MESFFSLLQENVLGRRRWSTGRDLRAAIVFWIESTYHRRRQNGLGRLTPVDYEALLRDPYGDPQPESTELGGRPLSAHPPPA